MCFFYFYVLFVRFRTPCFHMFFLNTRVCIEFSPTFLSVSLLFVWIILLYRGSFERSILASKHCYCNWVFIFVRYIFLACIHFCFIINFRSFWIFDVLQMNFSITVLVLKPLFSLSTDFVVWLVLVYFFT